MPRKVNPRVEQRQATKDRAIRAQMIKRPGTAAVPRNRRVAKQRKRSR